jgi:hypothetical protein
MRMGLTVDVPLGKAGDGYVERDAAAEPVDEAQALR